MEDERLIEMYFAREEAAIAETRARYGRRLRALAMAITGDAMEAEEAESDTYLRAWQTIPPERPRHFFAYLAKICRNRALTILERRGAEKRTATVVELSREMELCIPDRAAERAFDELELRRIMTDFLASLGAEGRAVFVRRYFSGLSVRDISRELSLSESKVKSSLFRARQRLRKRLEEEDIEI